MNITIGGITFDHHHYDERGDVLYLNVGKPRSEASGVETPEGHGIHYDETGAVIGLTSHKITTQATVSSHAIGRLTRYRLLACPTDTGFIRHL